MSAKRLALGRGLDSLIGPRTTPAVLPSQDNLRLLELPLAEIRPNINQPRKEFDEQHIQELADSIRELGILQPLLVRKQLDSYELIAGERRYRAATLLKLETVPCRVTDATDEKSFEMALVENLQREDLNAIEEARAYHSLVEQFGLTQEEVATRVGKNRSTVANSLRLLNLPADIQEDLLENRLTPGHARAILSLPDTPKQRALRNLILAKGFSVREAEAESRRMLKPKKPKPPQPDDNLQVEVGSLQEQLSMKIGLPVRIKAASSTSGKVEIQYHSLDDFDLLVDFFGIEKS